MSNKPLVVFYSHSGNTQKIAHLIQQQTQGELFEIEPVAMYPTDYNAVVEQAKKEIKAGFHPDLKAVPDHVAEYDTVFVGTPNWWSTIAPPLATFLSRIDLTGKTIVPFCTHGGGGGGRVENDIAALCPGAMIKAGLVLSGNVGSRAEALIAEWLRAVME